MKGLLNRDFIVRSLTFITIAFMAACGLYMVLKEVKPFWLDEWYIIDNLKFRSNQDLWGSLTHVQQFPRVYLHMVKYFAALFDYSYFSLRFPSFALHLLGILLCYNLSKKIFKGSVLYQCLWVLLYVSYPASTFYFVQVKQYIMEMFISLVAIWQLIILLRIHESNKNNTTGQYMALCIVSLFVPFLSYTAPVVAAPLFFIVLLNILQKDNPGNAKSKLLQALPLLLAAISIFIFYKIDVSQVTNDQGMQKYWDKDSFFMEHGFNLKQLLQNIYYSFYNMGRGAFMILFAAIGIISWLFGTVKSIPLLVKKDRTTLEYLVLYSVSLLWLSVILFIIHKLPLNAMRLNAYRVPATGILIIYFFDQLRQVRFLQKASNAVAFILLLVTMIITIQPLLRDFKDPEQKKKLAIYQLTQKAIQTAQQENIPMLVTEDVSYPYEWLEKGDWVIRTNPAYKRTQNIPVYPIVNSVNAPQVLDSLPPTITKALIVTSDTAWILNR